MEYKKYVVTVEPDVEAGLFHGEIITLGDVVTFQGRSIDELRQAFKESIEDYLEACAEFGKEPEKICGEAEDDVGLKDSRVQLF